MKVCGGRAMTLVEDLNCRRQWESIECFQRCKLRKLRKRELRWFVLRNWGKFSSSSNSNIQLTLITGGFSISVRIAACNGLCGVEETFPPISFDNRCTGTIWLYIFIQSFLWSKTHKHREIVTVPTSHGNKALRHLDHVRRRRLKGNKYRNIFIWLLSCT